MGLGLGPRSARIWAFWMAMRSQETRPDFEGPGRGFRGSGEGGFGCGGEYLVAGSISGVYVAGGGVVDGCSSPWLVGW